MSAGIQSFGYSVSGILDLDTNGYPGEALDLCVGFAFYFILNTSFSWK